MNIFVVAVVAVLSLMVGGAQAKQGKDPPSVIVAEAKTDGFADKVEALGTLRANEAVILTATVTETVTEINFEDGQRVEKGDILLEMTSAQEKSELDAEQATVEEAQRQVERLEPLIRAGAASKSLLDQRQRELETARARLGAVKSRIGDRVITAPFSGVLGLRNISVGAVLQPGMRITTLDDDSVMKLDFSVPSVFLSSLKSGLEIEASSRAFEGRVFKGKVTGIDSQIDPVTRSIAVRAIIPNEERLLKPGLLMSVEIFKNPREALVIPEEAIVPEGRRSFVFVVGNRDQKTIVQRKEISIGARQPGIVEVLDGISAGDAVVTHGTMAVSDGAEVTVRARDGGDQPLREMLDQKSAAGNGDKDAD